jgi:uncharacterized alkaline shock family protein YloU
VDRGAHLVTETDRGRVAISTDALAQIVGNVVAESYGVVGNTKRSRLQKLFTRDRPTRGVTVRGGADGLEIELTVVVEYGLNLAEVASTVRSRVGYEVTRQTGLPVAAVEVRIDDARRGA